MKDNKLIIGVCDDQEIWRDMLKRSIYDFCTSRNIEYVQREYSGAEEVLEAEEFPDILFLDIEMDGMTGIELKDYLEGKKKVRIVFVTSYTHYMREAFGKNVFGFLEKPIRHKDVEKYMKRMLNDFNRMECVVIEGVDGTQSVMLDKILYFKAEKKYSRAYTGKNEIFSSKGLSLWEEELKGEFFIRCHKSYLINLENVSNIKREIVMKNGEKIPCSRNRKKELASAYMAYIMEKAK